MAERGDENDVRIRGIDADPSDGLRIGESNVLPGLARVGRLVHAIALHDVAAKFRLAHADVPTSGFDSDTATAPTDELLICSSVTGFHVSPPSVVFHSPPPTAPK